MSELKLRRVIEHNQRLREDLARPRVRVSEASARCVCVPYAVDSVPGGARLGRAELTTRAAASSGTARRRKTTWCPQCGARSGARRTRTAHRPRGANAPSSDRARSPLPTARSIVHIPPYSIVPLPPGLALPYCHCLLPHWLYLPVFPAWFLTLTTMYAIVLSGVCTTYGWMDGLVSNAIKNCGLHWSSKIRESLTV